MGGWEDKLEKGFERQGRCLAKYPWVSLAITSIIAIGFCYGFAIVESETRPEEQWVARGAPALEQNEAVKNNWPSEQRINMLIANCKGEGCSVLDVKYIREMKKVHDSILNIVVDGNKITEELKTANKKECPELTKKEKDAGEKPKPCVFDQFNATWMFNPNATMERSGAKTKCFEAGPFCLQKTVLDIFKDDKDAIDVLTNEEALSAFNFWETQTNICPVSIGKLDSPCVDSSTWGPAGTKKLDCQEYKGKQQRENCRQAARNYCTKYCPTTKMCSNVPTLAADGSTTTKEVCRPLCKGMATCDFTNCKDRGCLTVQGFEDLESDNSVGGGNNNSAPAFSWQPFELRTVLGDIKKNGAGQITSAKSFFSFYSLAFDPVLIKAKGNSIDAVAVEWEKQALCKLGIDVDPPKKYTKHTSPKCPKNELFDFDINFSRSLGDEFGAAITGDLIFFAAGAGLMIFYLGCMLSERDSVHSMIGMSIVTVIVVLLSYAGGVGAGAYFGIKNNNLNQIIPFLILGLGVDDAFVLTSEFARASRLNPNDSVEERIAATARHGGLSILITSATDALAFLIGSVTVLPALSWFCQFSGIAVIFCFMLQIFFFLPALALNARRAEANRYDILCCFKAKTKHERDDPKGCCGCLCAGKSGGLPAALRTVGMAITTSMGKIVTVVVFVSLLGAGVVGMTQIYKDFKLEWFIPDDSYVREFFSANDRMFKTGERFTIYTGKDVDYFANQQSMVKMNTWLNTSDLIDQDEGISCWHHEFMESVRNGIRLDKNNGEDLKAVWDTGGRSKWLNADGVFGDKKQFYYALRDWYADGGGTRYRGSIQWVDGDCANSTLDHFLTPACDPSQGLKGGRCSATMALKHTERGNQRYDTMVMLRENVTKAFPGVDPLQAFPFSFQFLYWEEMGVIDEELVRNLLVCAAVILVMIAAMIPRIRISIWVAICIIMSIIDVVGMMHWWGVTISGVSTIYILISVGLAVDYSAHIAHMFKEEKGSARERAVEALSRIGPSVLNAVISTFLAVILMSTSKSYIFRIFFKALFLVTVIAGAHGLVFLPVVLSTFGGDNGERVDTSTTKGVVVKPSGGGSSDEGSPRDKVSVVPMADSAAKGEEV